MGRELRMITMERDDEEDKSGLGAEAIDHNVTGMTHSRNQLGRQWVTLSSRIPRPFSSMSYLFVPFYLLSILSSVIHINLISFPDLLIWRCWYH